MRTASVRQNIQTALLVVTDLMESWPTAASRRPKKADDWWRRPVSAHKKTLRNKVSQGSAKQNVTPTGLGEPRDPPGNSESKLKRGNLSGNTPDEIRLVRTFQQLSIENRKFVIEYVASMVENQKREDVNQSAKTYSNWENEER